MFHIQYTYLFFHNTKIISTFSCRWYSYPYIFHSDMLLRTVELILQYEVSYETSCNLLMEFHPSVEKEKFLGPNTGI
jgi:hypothetical protein